MKYKLTLWLTIVSMLFLAGCQREPMITISEETQAAIESKEASIKQEKEQQDESVVAQNNAETPITIDISSWTVAPEGMVWDVFEYVPIEPDQLLTYQGNDGTYYMYADYMDATTGLVQLRRMRDGMSDVTVEQISVNGVARVFTAEGVPFFRNMLSDSMQLIGNDTVLSAPITVGTTWQDASGNTNTISNLYQSGNIGEYSFERIVEVTVYYDGHQERYYYAANQGLILKEVIEGEQSAMTYLAKIERDVNLVQDIQMAIPVQDGATAYQWQTRALSWRTNDTAAIALTRLFQAENWLTSEVAINWIAVTGDLVEVDFTPGVVAAINAAAGQEELILPAIVETLARYYEVTNVRLTVEGQGLLPDRLPYPTNATWQVDPQRVSTPQ